MISVFDSFPPDNEKRVILYCIPRLLFAYLLLVHTQPFARRLYHPDSTGQYRRSNDDRPTAAKHDRAAGSLYTGLTHVG